LLRVGRDKGHFEELEVVMTAWERRMQAALLDAADQFARYAGYHLAKNPPDREKAATNTECAAMCREAAKEPDSIIHTPYTETRQPGT
jgi:hypothetical protein